MKHVTLKESLNRHAGDLSLSGRYAARGAFEAVCRALSKQSRVLSEKVRCGRMLEDHERWIYDNSALLRELFGRLLRERAMVPLCLLVLFDALLSEVSSPVSREDAEGIFAFLSDRGADHETLSCVRVALLAAVARALTKRMKTNSDVSSLIETARLWARLDLESLLSVYSPLEELLRLDPSGTYPKMPAEQRRRLCHLILRRAKKEGKSAQRLASSALKKARENGDYIGEYLPKETGHFGWIYSLLVTGTGLLLGGVFSAVLSGAYPLGAAALVGFLLAGQGAYSAAVSLFDALFGRLVRPRSLMRVQYPRLPKTAATMVVYTAMVRTVEEIDDLCEKLKSAYYASFVPSRGEEHLRFALLMDLGAEKDEHAPDDGILFSAATERIRRLNCECEDCFLLFTRPRTRQSDGTYSGWERKRGALLSLSRFLSGKGGEIVCRAGDEEGAKETVYVFTLDADTVLTPLCVQELVGILEHPLHRPVVETVRGTPQVTHGYGIVQPRVIPSAESAVRSPFSVLKTGAGGMTAYAGAAYDRAQTLFSRGHYCGKGLFHLPTFEAVLQDAFADESVLSHDLLEGARLSCAAATDVVLLDEVPSSPRAESEREHRWCRGDVQALFFSGLFSRDRKGRRRFNPIPFYYRTALWDNLRRALVPVVSATLLLLSLCLPAPFGGVLCLAALLSYVIPALVDVAYLALTGRVRGLWHRFFSPVSAGLWQRLWNLLYDLSALFFEAYLHADAILRALWRMCVSKKKRLEWKTASESAHARGEGLLEYLRARFVCLPLGALLLCFASHPAARAVGLLSVLHPFCASLLSRKFKGNSPLSEEAKGTLSQYACDQCRFFLSEVGEETRHLPPDHLTVAPVRVRAMRTSPTNIGLYLCSLCAAVDFGLLEAGEALIRIERCLSSVERLEKWRGLLYNWYDLTTGEKMNSYVSSVDCGNFAACLFALLGFLTECEERGETVGDLKRRTKTLIDEGNLKALYRPEEQLFAIGYDAQKHAFDPSHYDQYMSEARLTSYLAVALGQIPTKHWTALSRPLISRGGHLGAASFSGTTFEYFMPQLFLPLPHASFESEALCLAASEARRAAVPSPLGAVFGVSESAFFASDSIGDYPYRANGLSSLALRADSVGENVISPYSSFLMLPVLGEEAVGNLGRLKKLGLYGDYGFFEAAEVSKNGADVVKSTFAHHAGMSVVAAANAVFSGVFRRRFLRESALSAALVLLSERVPCEGIVHRAAKPDRPLSSPRPRISNRAIEADDFSCGAFVVPGKNAAMTVGLDGGINVLWREDGGLLLFSPEGAQEPLVLRALVDGVLYSSRLSENPDGARRRIAPIAGGVSVTVEHGARRVIFSLFLSGKEEAMECKTEVVGGAKRVEVALVCSPLLSSRAAFDAHPAFSALSLSAHRTSRAFFVRARKRGGREYALALSDESGVGDLILAESLADVGGGKKALLEHAAPKVREGVLSPSAVFCRRTLVSPSEHTHLTHRFFLGFGTNSTRAFFAMQSLSCGDKNETDEANRLAWSQLSRALQSAKLRDVTDSFSLALTHAVLNARAIRLVPNSERTFRREELYAHGISGDWPIVLCAVGDGEDSVRLMRAASLYRYHAICGFSYDLVFFARGGGYERRGLQAAMAAISRVGAEYLLARRGGGIFLVEGDERVGELLSCAACTEVKTPMSACSLPLSRRVVTDCGSVPTAFFEAAESPYAGSGSFLSNGFLIEKDRFDPTESFSHLLASRTFGALVTHRSLGFTFETSSRFRRISRVDADAFLPSFGERMILTDAAGVSYDLAAVSSKVLFSAGVAEYFGVASGVQYRLTVFCHPTLLFRGVRAEFYGRGRFELSYELSPVLGDETGVLGAFSTKLRGDTLLFERAIAAVSRPFSGYLKLANETVRRTREKVGLSCEVRLEGKKQVTFYLGAKESEEQFERVDECLRKVSFSRLLSDSVGFARRLLPPPVLPKGDDAHSFAKSETVNVWLAYQAISSRLFARCGLYQPGGAYGFRDQLQDALMYLSFEPNRCQTQILRHAAHQFPEGDVLHWWHNLPDEHGRHRGVRTRISDDYLWLVYAAHRYVEQTKDTDFLKREVPFLSGRALRDGEHDLYDAFSFGEKASMWEHLTAAADLFLARGVGSHGLSLMLAGDWNDGFDALGEGAESVFLSQFGVLCLRRLARLMRRENHRVDLAERYESFAAKLHRAVQNAFFGKWYARAFFGDGAPLGTDETLSSPCSIDLLPQAFSAFCFADSEERDESERARVFSALQSVWDNLYEKTSGVLRLFTPPFDTRGREVGYIRAYAAGVRENGGQYTHAAVWYALACRTMAPFSKQSELWRLRAEEVMDRLLPYHAALSPDAARRYRLEPYALAGDVYSFEGGLGRGGWNHYTGSAAWAWRYFAERDGELPSV